ncbi:hypothetical protein [Pseudomonas sp. TNT2022 ID642]|jgi:hypothetical protein|uniref:hypothetical protein n=1 Tax=Pseudomonas sp. TNT2022 ID642 TaxID=2942632 RepID=UPI00235E6ECF|nr:hypothetical protein [Pseudomonas sp. TNT2022 ID642]MDD1002347.1 hypothetical protein [Pseudomonas sp. TNT2022 ID642]
MTHPKASPAVWVNGILNVDVKGTIGGTPVNLTSFLTTNVSASVNELGGYNFSFEDNHSSSSRRSLSISLRKLLDPSIADYYEYVVTERGIHPYDYELTSSSGITVSQLNSGLYLYSLDNLQLSAKAVHGDETRELTGNGYFFLQELTYPI